ncbi:MAG: anti-sigma factor family protein [Gammaproteobacteria bacterium]
MIDERDIELVHADIDGEIGASQRERLRERLAASAELRAYKSRLQELAEVLDSVPPLEPPGDLRRELLQRVDLSGRHKSRFPSAGWRPTPIVLRYAAAFAAGLALTAILYETVSLDDQSPEELARLAGTMIYSQQPPGTTEEDRLVLQSDELRGDVTLHRGADVWIVAFHLDSSAPVEVAMKFGGLPFRGFAQLQDELGEVSIAGGAMRLVSDGKREFAVFLGEQDQSGASLELQFFAGDEQMSGGSLDAPKK